MAYDMLANSVEATKEASVQFAADARCVEVCLRGLEAGDEAIRVAAAKCVKAAAKRAPAFRGALAKRAASRRSSPWRRPGPWRRRCERLGPCIDRMSTRRQLDGVAVWVFHRLISHRLAPRI